MYRNRRTSVLAGLAVLLLPSILTAQITFERTYGGDTSDYAHSVYQTTDGGYVIAGSTASMRVAKSDVYLVRTDSLGDTLWTRTYGGDSVDQGRSVQQTLDGGFLVAGWTVSFGAGGFDVYLVKTNADGDTAWTRTFGGAEHDDAWSVQPTTDRGFIVAGATASSGAGARDVYLIKIDANGDTLWTRTYGGPGDDEGRSVQQTRDGGYIVTGETRSFGAGDDDVYLIKTDARGDTIWTRWFGGAAWDLGSAVRQTLDGGYIIAGHSESFGAGGRDVYLIKTDSAGAAQWFQVYGDASDDWARSVCQTADSGFVVAGSLTLAGSRSTDVYIIRTDANGDSLWTRTYGGGMNGAGWAVQPTTDGGYVVTGSVFRAGYPDFYLIKTDSLGRVSAVEEPESGPPQARPLGPTIVRGVLNLEAYSRQHTAYRAELLDISGRCVMTLEPGANDVSGLAPGVYFAVTSSPSSSPAVGERVEVRGPSAVSRRRSAVTVRKVVLAK